MSPLTAGVVRQAALVTILFPSQLTASNGDPHRTH